MVFSSFSVRLVESINKLLKLTWDTNQLRIQFILIGLRYNLNYYVLILSIYSYCLVDIINYF